MILKGVYRRRLVKSTRSLTIVNLPFKVRLDRGSYGVHVLVFDTGDRLGGVSSFRPLSFESNMVAPLPLKGLQFRRNLHTL